MKGRPWLWSFKLWCHNFLHSSQVYHKYVHARHIKNPCQFTVISIILASSFFSLPHLSLSLFAPHSTCHQRVIEICRVLCYYIGSWLLGGKHIFTSHPSKPSRWSYYFDLQNAHNFIIPHVMCSSHASYQELMPLYFCFFLPQNVPVSSCSYQLNSLYPTFHISIETAWHLCGPSPCTLCNLPSLLILPTISMCNFVVPFSLFSTHLFFFLSIAPHHTLL